MKLIMPVRPWLIKDLTGQIFGYWTTLNFAGCGETTKQAYFLCRCTCGNTDTVRGADLRNGKSQSCGCRSAQMSRERVLKHGATVHNAPEYRIWKDFRNRCENVNNKAYASYGGRGITVCERWVDFSNFLEDMGPRPSPKHSIDRRDNEKGYSPDNCRWATRTEQNGNTRKNVYVMFSGQRCSLPQLAHRFEVEPASLRYYYCDQKLPIATALQKAVRAKANKQRND